MKKLFIICLLTGCTLQPPVWNIADVSKTDGVVTLSYYFGEFHLVNADKESGIPLARSKCEEWGYTDATPLAGREIDCPTCSSYTVKVKYECKK